MKLSFFKNKKGFTITELLVSLVILLLALGIGYNFFFYAGNTFRTTENKWIKQREARQAGNFIGKQLKSVYALTVSNDNNPAGKEHEYDIFLKNNSIMFKDGIATPVKIADGNFNIVFNQAKNKDNAALSNVLDFKLTENNINYSVDSSVFLANMAKTKSIELTSNPGTSIHFKTTADIASIPANDLHAFCFIATAAYGTNTQPSVMLLRNFRDEYLMTNPVGKSFVEFYYKNSPPIAKKISNSEPLKATVRILLAPIVGIAYAIMHKEILMVLLLFMMLKIYYSRKKENPLNN